MLTRPCCGCGLLVHGVACSQLLPSRHSCATLRTSASSRTWTSLARLGRTTSARCVTRRATIRCAVVRWFGDTQFARRLEAPWLHFSLTPMHAPVDRVPDVRQRWSQLHVQHLRHVQQALPADVEGRVPVWRRCAGDGRSHTQPLALSLLVCAPTSAGRHYCIATHLYRSFSATVAGVER